MPDDMLEMALNLKYFQKFDNVGDRFSRVVAEKYFSPDIIACDDRPLTEPNLLLLGSILEWADAYSCVCGAGLIVPESKLRVRPKHINCVRGPLTAYFLERQGIPSTGLFADPGVLAPEVFPQEKSPGTKIGIIPHYKDSSSPWLESCRERGVTIIDPLCALREYFAALQDCEVILSSSLHGIIFAHAYGKPALWVELSDNVIGKGFKFYDYYLSIGVSPEQVVRLRVTDTQDPFEAAKRATTGDHARLRDTLETAMNLTRTQLQAFL